MTHINLSVDFSQTPPQSQVPTDKEYNHSSDYINLEAHYIHSITSQITLRSSAFNKLLLNERLLGHARVGGRGVTKGDSENLSGLRSGEKLALLLLVVTHTHQ